ncbi:MAG: hypothetical protein JNL11_02630 [Bdellovibrionaceae bacterium]|nr:hypothetical protein [Pseudobdellovibrionaceae bacterium]
MKKPLSIYDHMLLNIQCLSVSITPHFILYFKTEFAIENVQTHASNVYLFNIPVTGERIELDENQKKFIFSKEFSLYEEQYTLQTKYSAQLFDQLFKITWHGVAYHGEIKSL